MTQNKSITYPGGDISGYDQATADDVHVTFSKVNITKLDGKTATPGGDSPYSNTTEDGGLTWDIEDFSKSKGESLSIQFNTVDDSKAEIEKVVWTAGGNPIDTNDTMVKSEPISFDSKELGLKLDQALVGINKILKAKC